LNNNNRGNNRRRGRNNGNGNGNGNNRSQGGQQINRIDSRARGNAPQMLEKYKKLAHDAHLNGDRVAEEYNLQFADHYFRVMADQKQRQEDARQPRRDDHRQADFAEDYGSYDDPYGEAPSAPSAVSAPAERGPRQDREPRQEGRSEQRFEREPRPEREQRVEAAQPEAAEVAAEPARDSEGNPYEPPENPFVRDNRASRGLKQRKPRGPRREDGNEDGYGEANGNVAEPQNDVRGETRPDTRAAPAPVQEHSGNFDAGALPPSISTKPARKRAAAPAPAAETEAEAPAEAAAEEKPRRRRARKAASDNGGDDAGATPEAVNG
jgi:hypothetical protein